ncbi:CAAX prenyl protease 2 [Anthonomus grandis grandis]|uniref:CAAX prenyl protease 2 n=1 Tax=Anthonomus grandis grandis TaxID=2921223 RepID=UPI002165EBAA|nr:CAAX prenyl protease 2 [Anthonomus grandis grandis]
MRESRTNSLTILSHVTHVNVKMEHDFKPIFDCFLSLALCFSLSVTYLASLYVWKSPYQRDHPSTIKKRFISVFFMLFIAPCFLFYGLEKSVLQETSLLEILGLKTQGLLQAVILPLVLTMTLFLGPLAMEVANGFSKLQTEELDLIWVRSHIVAPFSEEFTYRSCMLPLLLQCLPPITAVLINPLFFGIAHLHHTRERLKFGMDFKTAIYIGCFQFAYTTIFGAYSAYLFYRTGHFLTTFVVHAFCNHMGFPDFLEVASYERGKKLVISTLFVLGLVLWCFLLKPLTDPTWYHHFPKWYSIL